MFYSCTPGCCFNHVCSDCGTTFETVTAFTGKELPGIVAPDPLPDASDPTAECVRCNSIAVYLTDGGAPVCATCGAVLTLELAEIAPGGNS